MTRHEYALWGAVANAVRGNALPHSKLNPEAVRLIRENREGLTMKAQAERFGVHHRTIEKVRSFETWGHV